MPILGTKCLPDCSAAAQLPQSSPRHSHIAKLRSAFMLMSGGSQGLAHLCASTGVQGLFDPISTKKCLENYVQTHRTKRDVRSTFIRLFGTCISLPLKRIHCKIEGEVFWLGVSLLVFLLSFRQWLLTIRHPYSSKDCRRFTLRSLFPLIYSVFFLSPERPAPLQSIAHQKQNARTFCYFIFHEPEGIFMSNFLSPSCARVSTGTCFFRRAWTTG